MNKESLRRLLFGFGISILAACSSTVPDNRPTGSTPGASTTVHNLRIGRAGRASLSDGQADSILAGATRTLVGINSPGDSSANVLMQRDGPVQTIAGPAVINSESDFARLKSSGVDVAIVEGINECGGFIPNIVGCAPVPGTFMAVVRLGSLEDILWAHEYGHNCGLRHRNDSTAVMHPQLGSQHRSLLRSEAERYENKTRREGATRMPGDAAQGEARVVVVDDGPPPATMEEYFDRIYLHGIPFEQVAGFGPEHVASLKSVLSNSGQQKVWGNAVVALAAIATPEAIDAVLKFIFDGRGMLSPNAYQAKRAALMALGYSTQQALRHASAERRQAVLAQLRAGLSSDYWRQRLNWRAPGHTSTEETALRLSNTALAGLALSGAREAAPWFAEAARQPGAEQGKGLIASKARQEFEGPRAGTSRLYQAASPAR